MTARQHSGLRSDAGTGPANLADAARAAGVRDERVLSAMRELPRALFVPAGSAARAYLDAPLRISHRQVTSQPSLVAKMVEALAPSSDQKVLEIGTGYGYQTALLARLAREVWSIERWHDMTDGARASLAALGITNVTLRVGDGTRGLPDGAPFDAIIVAAAYPEVPPPLTRQLARGGRLVQPIGPGGMEDVRLFEKRDSRLVVRRSITAARFVPLYGRHGYSHSRAPDD